MGTIIVQSGDNRIIQHDDRTLAPQRFEGATWQYEYYQDGRPVVVANTPEGLRECERWAGLRVDASFDLGVFLGWSSTDEGDTRGMGSR